MLFFCLFVCFYILFCCDVFWMTKLHSTFQRDGLGLDFSFLEEIHRVFQLKSPRVQSGVSCHFSETINSSQSGFFFFFLSECPKKKLGKKKKLQYKFFSVEKRPGISGTPNTTPGLGKQLFYDILICEVKDRIAHVLHLADHRKDGAIFKAATCCRTTAQKRSRPTS